MAGIQSFENKLFQFASENQIVPNKKDKKDVETEKDAEKKVKRDDEDDDDDDVDPSIAVQRFTLGFLVAMALILVAQLALLIVIHVKVNRPQKSFSESEVDFTTQIEDNEGKFRRAIDRQKSRDESLHKKFNELKSSKMSDAKLPEVFYEDLKKEITKRMEEIHAKIESGINRKFTGKTPEVCRRVDADLKTWKRIVRDEAEKGVDSGVAKAVANLTETFRVMETVFAEMERFSNESSHSAANITKMMGGLGEEIERNLNGTVQVLDEVKKFRKRFVAFVQEEKLKVDTPSVVKMNNFIKGNPLIAIAECLAEKNASLKFQSLIPNFYSYDYDCGNVEKCNHMIRDGGKDLFDNGNFLSVEIKSENSTDADVGNKTVRMEEITSYAGDAAFVTSKKSMPFQLVGIVGNVTDPVVLTIQQCANYGADGKGKHRSSSGEFNVNSHGVHLTVSFYTEELYGTRDASVTKVFYVVEASSTNDAELLVKVWRPGKSLQQSCDSLSVLQPKNLVFGYTLLSRYENNYFNKNSGDALIQSVLRSMTKTCVGSLIGEAHASKND